MLLGCLSCCFMRRRFTFGSEVKNFFWEWVSFLFLSFFLVLVRLAGHKSIARAKRKKERRKEDWAPQTHVHTHCCESREAPLPLRMGVCVCAPFGTLQDGGGAGRPCLAYCCWFHSVLILSLGLGLHPKCARCYYNDRSLPLLSFFLSLSFFPSSITFLFFLSPASSSSLSLSLSRASRLVWAGRDFARRSSRERKRPFYRFRSFFEPRERERERKREKAAAAAQCEKRSRRRRTSNSPLYRRWSVVIVVVPHLRSCANESRRKHGFSFVNIRQ